MTEVNKPITAAQEVYSVQYRVHNILRCFVHGTVCAYVVALLIDRLFYSGISRQHIIRK